MKNIKISFAADGSEIEIDAHEIDISLALPSEPLNIFPYSQTFTCEIDNGDWDTLHELFIARYIAEAKKYGIEEQDMRNWLRVCEALNALGMLVSPTDIFSLQDEGCGGGKEV